MKAKRRTTQEAEQRALCRAACNICDPEAMMFTANDMGIAIARRYKMPERLPISEVTQQVSRMGDMVVCVGPGVWQYVEE